ncbi:MAG TPA: sigma factor-like helix-turn-helix DNA-binding protein, partial [Chloroflexia bacterium]|nr:sigma factor-like helix-turn-helix DNA-binding protein [Chloroflexia bacterium]
MVTSATLALTLPATWPPAPKDLLPQLQDPTFRDYFVRAIDEAVKDPVDRAVMLGRYALWGPAMGEPETLQQLADRHGVSRDRIKQRLARAWSR